MDGWYRSEHIAIAGLYHILPLQNIGMSNHRQFDYAHRKRIARLWNYGIKLVLSDPNEIYVSNNLLSKLGQI